MPPLLCPPETITNRPPVSPYSCCLQVEFRMAVLRFLTWLAEMELWLRGESWGEAARDVGEAAAGQVNLPTAA